MWLPLLLLSCAGAVTHIPREPAPGYPVILIPGDIGNRLEGKLINKPETVNFLCDKTTNEYFSLWMSLPSFLPLRFDCWLDNMRLVFDNATKTSHNVPGVDVRVPDFGSTSSIEWTEPYQTPLGRYMYDLVEALVSWGYTRGKDVAGAPYDFRKAAFDQPFFFKQLKNLTEHLYISNGNKKVVFVAHSMGNIMFKYFIDQIVDAEWKAKHVRSFVSIAAPWGGVMQMVQLYASGFTMDIPLLPPLKVRPLLRSWTSSALLFPNTAAWNSSEVLATDKKTMKNYTTANIREFFTDIGYALGWEQYKMAGILEELRAPDVETHCIYGYGMETPDQYEWAAGDFPDRPPRAVSGDGDGNVNRRSAEVCLKWHEDQKRKAAKAANNQINITAIAGVNHLALMRDRQVIQHVRRALYDDL